MSHAVTHAGPTATDHPKVIAPTQTSSIKFTPNEWGALAAIADR